MKILQLISRADTIGGGQTHVLELSVALQNHGHEVVVATGPSGPFSEELVRAGITTIALDSLRSSGGPRSDLAAMRALRAVIDEEAPDLLACHSTKAGILGRIVARQAKVPSVYTLHGVTFSPGTSTVRRFPAWVVELAMRGFGAHVIAVSQFDADLALRSRIVPRARLHTVLNSVVDRDWKPQPAETPTLVMVARFEPQKDHATLFEALARLGDSPWSLVLLGDGRGLDAARQHVAELGISERVKFDGLVSDVTPYLERAYAFVLISNYEGLPISILESMSCGLPIVATDVGGVNELVVDGLNGRLVGRGDVDGAQAALDALLGDPEEARTMGIASRIRYEEVFGFERFMERTLDVYRSAVGAAS